MSMLKKKYKEPNNEEEESKYINKERIKFLIFLIAALFVIFIAAGTGSMGGRKKIYGEQSTASYDIRRIRRSEFDGLIEKGGGFVVMFGRASCRQCSVVEYVLSGMDIQGVPFYILDLEAYYGSDEYEEIKSEAGITYVPTFLFYENGERRYCMNNPLPDGYFDDDITANERLMMRDETAKKIVSFFKGITGEGEVVDEEPLSDIVTGVSEANKSGG